MTTTTVPDAATVLAETRALIEGFITNQPRSLQKRIGPSELGAECTACLAARLAGWNKTDDGVPWLPYVGTAMHAQLEYEFTLAEGERAARDGGPARWLVEQSVMVGHLGGEEVWGSCDLFDTHAGMSIDWKLTGANTLRSAKRGPSPVYRTQAQLYGTGWVNAGYDVHHVAIAYLPRGSVTLNDAIWWHEPYDPQVAVDALARANHLHTQLTALASISVDARDQWIRALPRAEKCWDCHRFGLAPAGTPKPGHRPPADQLAGLISPTAPAAGSNAA